METTTIERTVIREASTFQRHGVQLGPPLESPPTSRQYGTQEFKGPSFETVLYEEARASWTLDEQNCS